jgi:predicted phage terminase large subunit-like protein
VKIIPDELLPLLTEEEANRYKLLLERELALTSPLDLACWLRPKTRRWKHIEHINEHLLALVEYRLYADGPGPPACWFYVPEDDPTPIPVSSPDDIPDEGVAEFYGLHPQDPESRVVLRLAIAAPPRHGKSYLITETFPLWYWMRYPDRSIALATYSDDFAADWGVKIKDMLYDEEEKIGLALVNGRRSASAHLRLEGQAPHVDYPEPIKASGEMFLVGSRGGLTGRGYQLGIIDDPFKDAADAESQAERNARANWYTSVFMSRKTRTPGKGLPVEVMVFTRWHIDDIAGRFVYDEEGAPRPDWCHVRLPALAEPDDPLGRAEGEALCSQVKTQAELIDLQSADPYWFASLYQGSPVMRKGGIIPGFRRYSLTDGFYTALPVPEEDLPTFPGSEALADDLRLQVTVPRDRCTRFATVDLAASKASYADWSVYSVWDWDHETALLFLAASIRERVESAQHKLWVQECHSRYPVTFVAVEERTFGLTLIQDLILDRQITVRPLKTEGDKITRAVPYGQAVGRGRVLIPKSGVWVAHWTAEHASFPAGRHDDMVDTGAYAWRQAQLLPRGRRDEKKEPVTTEEKIQAFVDKRQRRKVRPGYHDLLM